jgi:LysM repeat protein
VLASQEITLVQPTDSCGTVLPIHTTYKKPTKKVTKVVRPKITPKSKIYIVKHGDTRAIIAEKIGKSIDYLKMKNPKVHFDNLKTGQKLNY